MDWQALLNSSASLLLSAFLLDLAVGDPRWFPHPVVLMGKFISRGEILLWTGNVWRDFICGMVLSLALIAWRLERRGRCFILSLFCHRGSLLLSPRW